MKNTLKLFGVIALVAVIGFSMVACGGDDDKGGSGKITITVTSISSDYDYGRLTVYGDGYYYDSNYEGSSKRQPLTGTSVTFDMRSQVSMGTYFTKPGIYKIFLYLQKEGESEVEHIINSKQLNAGNNTIPFSEF
jgi:hypothetical protein